ncbi:MAG TPA: hypothetical protein VGA22_13015 [Gemmatimonadales bacterium]|jgi:hypothetical protein
MFDSPDAVTDPVLRSRLQEIQERLARGLAAVDPHGRLEGRPVKYRVIGGQTLEVIFREVPSVDESDVLGVRRLIGHQSFCRVTPQSAETLEVRFVVPLTTDD